MIGYIYKTTNLFTNKIYVGKHEASQFESNKYIGSGKIIKALIKEFGKSAFKCELLDTAETLEELWNKELYWIATLKSQDPAIGYNILDGGSGCSGYQFTPEIKAKMSKAATKNNLNRDPTIYKEVAKKHIGNKFMNKDGIQKWVAKSEITAYLKDGWHFGACKKRNRIYQTGQQWQDIHKNDNRKGRTWIHKGNDKKWITNDLLEDYLTAGWKLKMKD